MLNLNSLEDTEIIANAVVPFIAPQMVLGFSGDLGAGKTTFIKYLMKALGCGEPVSSPTYVLCHEYKTPRGLLVEHWDLYRIETIPIELVDGPGKNALQLVEWVEKEPMLFFRSEIVFEFHRGQNETERNLEIVGPLAFQLAEAVKREGKLSK